MKNNVSKISCKRGFTLIELLVVVLIIGVLVAVAVPQYNKAVDKSRLMNLIQMGTNVRKAQEVYFLQNGTYASNVSDLDVVYEESCSRGTDLTYYYCKDGDLDNIVGSVGNLSAHAVKIWYKKNKQYILTVWIYFAHSSKPNQVICEGSTDYGTKLCNTLNL